MTSSSPEACSIEAWEAAYLAFETAAEARRKMKARLRRFGLPALGLDAPILEICCGAGFGLDALLELGFTCVDGLDLSRPLLGRYAGPAGRVAGDCRRLPFIDGSKRAVVVHGGLHHLETLDDVEAVLAEVARVLEPDGTFCFVEPWLTPFLRLVLFCSANRLLRRSWKKLDAFQTMVEHERRTYEHWLGQPASIERRLQRWFEPRVLQKRWGGLTFVGVPRQG